MPDFWLSPGETEARYEKPQLPDILNKAYIFFKKCLKNVYSTPITTCHHPLPLSALSAPPAHFLCRGREASVGRNRRHRPVTAAFASLRPCLPVGAVRPSHARCLKSRVSSLGPAPEEQKGSKSHKKKT